MNRKGVSLIIGATLLLIIAIGLGLTYIFWAEKAQRNVGNASKEFIEHKKLMSEANFKIDDIQGNKIIIKNIGNIELDANTFNVYLNSTFVRAVPDKNIIKPGDVATLTITDAYAPGKYLVKVGGQYGLIDEIEWDM